ncbi:50S ribosomal protein L29 [bacterium Unc6]|nr:50S ribosomal protein L29 [bacterium Unc6]
MKAKEIRTFSAEERKNRLGSLKKEIYDIECRKKTGEAQSSGKVRNIRKDIARILTVMNQKEQK